MPTIVCTHRGTAALILLMFVSPVGGQLRAESSRAPAEPVIESAELFGDTESVPEVVEFEANQKPDEGDYLALRDDDAWLISTRHLGCPSWKGESPVDLEVSRFSGEDTWIESDLDALLNSDPRHTVVYVHGNRVSADDAITRAWNAFRVLQADPTAPPMRLIIWSWPSDRIHGQIRDVRYKGARTNTEGQYLGWFLAQWNAETPLSLIGYSYGARVITGALHVLGGGTLVGQSVPLHNASGDRAGPVKVVLMAAALHNYWLSSGGYHDRFWSFADRLLVLFNSCDPVLKRYRFIEKRGRPVALGYGSAWGLDDNQASRTEQRDVCCSVGKTHNEAAFFSSTEVVDAVQQHVLWDANR